MKINLQSKLQEYLPSLFQLIEGDIRWVSLNNIFNEKFNALNEKYKRDEKFPLIRLTLYSIIIGALKGDKNCKWFHRYIDNLFKDINHSLGTEEKLLIKQNISNLLEFGNGFLNYLGELSVLNYYLKTGIYKLIDTEVRKNNITKGNKKGKGIDFKFYDKKINKDILIEVVNIELNDDKMLNYQTIYKFLSCKLKDKLADTDKSGILDYVLIPVIWGSRTGSLNNILKVKEFYEVTNFKIERVKSPMTYIPFIVNGNDNDVKNKFESINTIFNDTSVK